MPNNFVYFKVWSNQTLLKGNDFEVVSLVVLDDGSLASGYWNGDIIIWNTTNRTQIKVLISHTSTVNCLVFFLATHWPVDRMII